MKVTRYRANDIYGLMPTPAGSLCLYEDYLALLESHQELLKMVKAAIECPTWKWDQHNAAMQTINIAETFE